MKHSIQLMLGTAAFSIALVAVPLSGQEAPANPEETADAAEAAVEPTEPAVDASAVDTNIAKTTEIVETAVVPAEGAVEEITQESNAPKCELHVFPTTEGRALTTGWLSGFGIVGAVADAAKNGDRNINEGEYLKEALGPRLQIEAFSSINLVETLGIPPSAITFEKPIADRRITTKSKERLTESSSKCYYELIVTQNFYTKKALYGRSLNNRFIFKDFSNGVAETKLIKGRGGNGLKHFPPKTTDETEVAEQELRDVFVKNFLEYARRFEGKR